MFLSYYLIAFIHQKFDSLLGIWWAIVDQVANFFLTLHEPTYLPPFAVAAK
jgi:hypothetical protein